MGNSGATATAGEKKAKVPGDPVRTGITRVQRILEGLNDEQRVRVLRATGLAFGYDLNLVAKPESRAFFDGDGKATK